MTAYLLTLNSSKTEYFLIGLKQQLAKSHDWSINITYSAVAAPEISSCRGTTGALQSLTGHTS